MGCTSSTVNVPESQTSTTDNIENNMLRENSEDSIKKNDIISSITKELDQTQVLPQCENTNNASLLPNDDNNKYSSDNNEVNTKGNQDTTSSESQDDNLQIAESSPLKENFLSLKALVEQVISDNIEEDEQITDVTETRIVDLDRKIEEIITNSNVNEDVGVESLEDEAKESPSPTQSEDSRATRWEALADIAAELPPSLAVDPLTGQIYSLTK